jgi:hypothetical protein
MLKIIGNFLQIYYELANLCDYDHKKPNYTAKNFNSKVEWNPQYCTHNESKYWIKLLKFVSRFSHIFLVKLIVTQKTWVNFERKFIQKIE